MELEFVKDLELVDSHGWITMWIIWEQYSGGKCFDLEICFKLISGTKECNCFGSKLYYNYLCKSMTKDRHKLPLFSFILFNPLFFFLWVNLDQSTKIAWNASYILLTVIHCSIILYFIATCKDATDSLSMWLRKHFLFTLLILIVSTNQPVPNILLYPNSYTLNYYK